MLLKAPTWRRDHVQDLLDSSTTPTSRFEDKKTISAYHFFKEYQDANHDKQKHIYLERYYPKFTGAVELHSRMDLGFRWFIEAAIMANIPSTQIAEEIDVPTEVVETYEDLFFDVRKHLTKQDYIISMIFFPSYRAGIHGRDFDTLWKMMAYYGSFEVVRDFNSHREMSADTRKWVDVVTRAKLAKNAFIASQVITPNQYNANEVIDSYINLLKIEKESAGVETTESEVITALKPLFGSISMTFAQRGIEGQKDEPRFLSVEDAEPNPLDVEEKDVT